MKKDERLASIMKSHEKLVKGTEMYQEAIKKLPTKEELEKTICTFNFEAIHYKQINGNKEILTVSYYVTDSEGILKDIDTLLIHELNLEHKSLTINENKRMQNPYYSRVVFSINHILQQKLSMIQLKEALDYKKMQLPITIKGED